MLLRTLKVFDGGFTHTEDSFERGLFAFFIFPKKKMEQTKLEQLKDRVMPYVI
jgi:hypothetical protein